jgi:ABC-type antimicrobial peptide transport system permease subunit
LTATLAVLLGIVGLYATLAYTVSLRRHELSIRMALGATIGRLAADVARPAGRLVGMGLVCGGFVAWLASRAIGGLLFGVDAHDEVTFLVAAGFVSAVSIAAIVASLGRLRSVTPVQALQSE